MIAVFSSRIPRSTADTWLSTSEEVLEINLITLKKLLAVVGVMMQVDHLVVHDDCTAVSLQEFEYYSRVVIIQGVLTQDSAKFYLEAFEIVQVIGGTGRFRMLFVYNRIRGPFHQGQYHVFPPPRRVIV